MATCKHGFLPWLLLVNFLCLDPDETLFGAGAVDGFLDLEIAQIGAARICQLRAIELVVGDVRTLMVDAVSAEPAVFPP
jgi:hypothetical protein